MARSAGVLDRLVREVDAAGASREARKDEAEPLPASFVGGRYAVTALLGEGKKKKVCLAHDTALDRDVTFTPGRAHAAAGEAGAA